MVAPQPAGGACRLSGRPPHGVDADPDRASHGGADRLFLCAGALEFLDVAGPGMVARRTGEGNRETPLCPVRNGGLLVPAAAGDHIDPWLDQAAWRAPLAEPAPAGLCGGGRRLHSLCDAGEGQSGCPENIYADPGGAYSRALPSPAEATISGGCGSSNRSGPAYESVTER